MSVSIDESTIRHIARLSRIDLSEDRIPALLDQFREILTYFDKLGELDTETAEPLARAAVAVARRHGCRSFVVPHGAPCCRFGFSPAAADNLLAWGESSRRKNIK